MVRLHNIMWFCPKNDQKQKNRTGPKRACSILFYNILALLESIYHKTFCIFSVGDDYLAFLFLSQTTVAVIPRAPKADILAAFKRSYQERPLKIQNLESSFCNG